MNKELFSLCKQENFEEVYKVLESKTTRPSLLYKDMSLSQLDFNYLREFTEESAKCFLLRNQQIPDHLLYISELLGQDHMDSLRFSITNYVTSQQSAELSQYLATNFHNLGSIKLIFDFLEKSVENCHSLYGNLPIGWNIDLKIVTKSFIMIKQRICDYFFVADVDQDSYAKSLLITINFEKKLKPFFDHKKCCMTCIGFRKDDIITHNNNSQITCQHAKMLSSIFIPYLELLYKHYFKPFLNIRFNQSICEMYIIETFLIFFREVGQVYDKLSYFEDIGVFNDFLVHLDHCLGELLKKIHVEDGLECGIAVLSTLVYVQDTLRDLLQSIQDTTGKNYEMQSFTLIGKLEKYQNYKIDRFINCSLSSLSSKSSNFLALKRFFETHILSLNNISDEVRSTLLETIMAHLFSKISLIKMSPKSAEILLCDMCELEEFLMSNFDKIPHLKTIKEYLKIFICPVEPKEKFVDNFTVLSGNLFSFHQILNAMENQEPAADLFMIYKKRSKTN